jgi:multidrug transporter EmrE-like cation transporter
MTLSPTQISQLIAFAAMLSCGQLLFKVTASTLPPLTSVNSFIGLFTNVWFWGAIVLYGAATLLWIFILQQTPLSLAYPFVSLGFVILPIAASLLFKEPLNLYYALGVLLIISGLTIITMLASK